MIPFIESSHMQKPKKIYICSGISYMVSYNEKQDNYYHKFQNSGQYILKLIKKKTHTHQEQFKIFVSSLSPLLYGTLRKVSFNN